MHPNLSSHLIETRRAELLRAASSPHPEHAPRRRLQIRWRRRTEAAAAPRRLAPVSEPGR